MCARRRVFLAQMGLVVLLFSACSPDDGDDAPAVDAQVQPTRAATPVDASTLDLPPFEIVERRDVSYDFAPGDAAQRLVLRVEIPGWPVSKEELEAIADQLIEDERGEGWQAISISMGADRDETGAAYAVFEWAPDGDWARASEGDPDTWAGYELSVDWGSKMENPEEAECAKPPPIAFRYNREL